MSELIALSGLIALTRVALHVGGVRVEFAPGEKLPELTKHDRHELLRMGAIADPAAEEAANKAEAAAQAQGAEEFAAARARVIEAHESSKPPAPVGGSTEPPPPPASAKPAAKTTGKK